MLPEDRVRFVHMVEAAREALSFSEGKSLEDIRKDRMLQLAVVKCVEIIGEAAGRLSAGARDSIPELPWPAIITMRNRLVHVYFDVSPTALWSTVTEDLPPLIRILESVLNEDPDAP